MVGADFCFQQSSPLVEWKQVTVHEVNEVSEIGNQLLKLEAFLN